MFYRQYHAPVWLFDIMQVTPVDGCTFDDTLHDQHGELEAPDL